MINTEIRLIIFFAAKDGETLYSRQKQDQELSYGSDHELLIAKFRLKLKKVGKTTRPFRYDINQIPYKEMATHSSTLAWKIPWTEVHDMAQEAVIKTIPKKKNCKKAKWLPYK